MKRSALVLFFSACVAPSLLGAPNAVDELFKQAQTAINARNFDAALPFYEQVIVEHPEAVNRWYDAQAGIAQTLAKKGDLAGAAKAVHLCLDGAPDPRTFESAISLAAAILSALDQNVGRANQFIAFQQTGPAGGAVNPMDAIGYPELPDRERAFVAMRQQAGDTPAASRIRAFTFLFTGKPKDALAQFADAFRRSSTPATLERSGADLVLVGLRAVRGHRIGLDKDLQFVILGPNGPDGKPGTGDDIADPFAQFLPAAPAPGEGGLAELSPDDLQLLRQVHDAAQLYAGDNFLSLQVRRSALSALWRTNDALDNWGVPGQKEWYLEIEKHVLDIRKSQDFRSDWDLSVLEEKAIESAQLVVKGRSLHLGAIPALMDEIAALCTERGGKTTEGIDKARYQFSRDREPLTKIVLKNSALKPFTAPAKF